MPKIKSQVDLIKWVELQLGAPFHNIEVTEDQYAIIVDDCVDRFRKWNYGDGSIFSYGVFNIIAGKVQYNLRDATEGYPLDNHGLNIPNTGDINSPDFDNSYINIEEVDEVKFTSGRDGINQLFSTENMLLSDGALPFSGGAPESDGLVTTNQSGTIGSTTGSSVYDYMTPLSNYVQSMSNLETINKLFSTSFTAQWRSNAGILQIWPTPSTDGIALLSYWGREKKQYLFNDELFKEFFEMSVQKQWGKNLKKFNHTLAGGGELDAQGMYDDAVDKLTEIKDQIKGESEQPGIYIG